MGEGDAREREVPQHVKELRAILAAIGVSDVKMEEGSLRVDANISMRREGSDVTIVAVGWLLGKALAAAERLAAEGIDAEVIDPRTLRPLDLDTILESVKKTNRAVIVEEGWPHGGVGANMAALIQEQAFDWLDAPVQRVTGADVPMPYSKPLEQAAFPHEEHVVSAVLATFGDV